ncbi:MAG: hypothetical protein LOD87_12915, partial [Planifilum fulgidum]
MIYRNETYGFRFALPESWRGYSVILGRWEGEAVEGPQAGETVETGPMISLRHPDWTEEHPRQDIPILILTHAQWDAIRREAVRLGAAPVPPSELGRNEDYVFALPARYNFAFPEGHEEVTDILEGDPLQPFTPTSPQVRPPEIDLRVSVEQNEMTMPFMLLQDPTLPFSTYLFTDFVA